MEQTPIECGRVDAPTRDPLRVLCATPWATACGIAEHSRMLKAAVEGADPLIAIDPVPEALDSSAVYTDVVEAEERGQPYHVLHLNYHAALHSRWDADAIRAFRHQTDLPVLVTYHDTGVPNSAQCRAVIDAADAAVVHEPFDDLPPEKTYYWRMGVEEIVAGGLELTPLAQRPWLGTVGFPFPWKNYDELARVTEAAGWGLLLIAPGATEEDVTRWRRLNPALWLVRDFVSAPLVQNYLRACDATAFCYVTHNTGQSGAILQGIAAKKPVIALHTCRQFRALYRDPLGMSTIHWCETFAEVRAALVYSASGVRDHGIVALAHQERWSLRGRWYAALLRQLADGGVR